jgi:hypothetical protein
MQSNPEFQAEKLDNQNAATVRLESLVKAAQDGNLDAFGNIVELFQKRAYALGYSRLGDFHQAQDAAQEALESQRCWRLSPNEHSLRFNPNQSENTSSLRLCSSPTDRDSSTSLGMTWREWRSL